MFLPVARILSALSPPHQARESEKPAPHARRPSGAGLGLSLSFLLFAACGARYEPVVDLKNIDLAQYHQDLEECQSYAEHLDPMEDVGTSTLAGSAVGAVAGGGASTITGDSLLLGAAAGAAGGTALGAGKGAMNMTKHQKKIIRRCLKGRGYKVLG